MRASEPGAVTYRLSVRPFYSSFTNIHGDRTGWWERETRNIERDGERLLAAAGREIGPAILEALAYQAFKEIASIARASGFEVSGSFAGRVLPRRPARSTIRIF